MITNIIPGEMIKFSIKDIEIYFVIVEVLQEKVKVFSVGSGKLYSEPKDSYLMRMGELVA